MTKTSVWRLTLRKLALCKGERHEFSLLVVTGCRNERDVVKFAKTRIHSPEWWEGYLITDVVQVGEVWASE